MSYNPNKNANVRLHKDTRNRLDNISWEGESYDAIINRLLNTLEARTAQTNPEQL